MRQDKINQEVANMKRVLGEKEAPKIISPGIEGLLDEPIRTHYIKAKERIQEAWNRFKIRNEDLRGKYPFIEDRQMLNFYLSQSAESYQEETKQDADYINAINLSKS